MYDNISVASYHKNCIFKTSCNYYLVEVKLFYIPSSNKKQKKIKEF